MSESKIEVAPSILAADFGRLNEDVALIEEHSDWLHIDVMDGHFVPNISFGAPVMRCLKTDLPLDVHLMISEPWRYLKDFADAGARRIVVHEEVCRGEAGSEDCLMDVLQAIEDLGCVPGVSIKPGTSVDVLDEEVLAKVGQVLVMTVEPGFGGQKFMEDMMPKIRSLRERGFDKSIGVDGGVNAETARVCVEAGADFLVAGSYVFKAEDPVAAVQSLKF